MGNNPVNAIDPDGRAAFLIPLAIIAYRAYSAYDTVSSTIDNAKTITSDTASTTDKILAAVDTASNIGCGKICGKASDALSTAVRNTDNVRDAARVANKTCCFVAGTLIDTETGLKPIQEIKIGDKVWARNTDTGETALKFVTDLIRRHERIIWDVKLTGPVGEAEWFETTDDHPWWVAGQGWRKTKDLVQGMSVITKDGRGMVVSSTAETERVETTYNLTVADFETYFVGEQRVLVHNCPTGSYTNTHASGKKYHGKGDADRAATSANRVAKENKDPLVKTETRTASSDRESFKQESRSLDADGGPGSPNNYNKIDSPGKKFREEDGEL